MTTLNETYTLANGIQIPKIGMGTWMLEDLDQCYDLVLFALKNGYRHIDTAQAYHNESAVGRAIRDSGIDRKEIFVTSKLSANTKDYAGSLKRFETTMEELSLDYLDLYLIHAPWPWDDRSGNYDQENVEVWRAMEDIYKSGRVRAIGLSNFNARELQNILDHCTIKPMVNQLRLYIGNMQEEAVACAKDNGVLVEAHSPFAHGRLLDNPAVKAMDERYGKSLPQLAMRYLLQKDLLPLPKTTHTEYLVQNADVDFTISAEDMAYLDTLKDPEGRR